MYSLDCDYYTKEFDNIHELIDDILKSGMDSGIEITKNGKCTGEIASDLIVA